MVASILIGPQTLLAVQLPSPTTPTVPSLTWYRLVPPWPFHPLPTSQHLLLKVRLIILNFWNGTSSQYSTNLAQISIHLWKSQEPVCWVLLGKHRIRAMVPPWTCEENLSSRASTAGQSFTGILLRRVPQNLVSAFSVSPQGLMFVPFTSPYFSSKMKMKWLKCPHHFQEMIFISCGCCGLMPGFYILAN